MGSVFFLFIISLFSELEASEARYMGMGSCSSSGCHGKVAPFHNTSVLQNEYSTWARRDQHSKAYQNLMNIRGRAIARNLGIEHPDKAADCLMCHATFVQEASLRGDLYRVEDGVSCESCHGAAEHYLKPHSVAGSSREKNLEYGLIDLTNPKTRAEICLDCHQGSRNARLTHRLYAAGHPRLSFELDTYSEVMPKHWKVDQDYIRRKGKYSHARLWLMGQAVRAERMLMAVLDREHFYMSSGMLQGPDFAVMNCYECHHRLKDNKWRFAPAPGPLGLPKFNLASVLVLAMAFESLDPQISSELQKYKFEFEAGLDYEKAGKLLETSRKAIRWLESKSDQDFEWKKIADALAQSAQDKTSLSFEEAEQILMALTSLYSEVPGLGKGVQKHFDRLYSILEHPSRFDSRLFESSIQKLSSQN